MNQTERRIFLIKHLLAEHPNLQQEIPEDGTDQIRMLRGLMNIREPKPVSHEILAVQDAYLQEERSPEKVVHLADLEPVQPGIYLVKGDITMLECGAIVNAANSGMTGCYMPNHRCIDNCIHTYAGMQLRWKCAQIMEEQGYPEPVGQAKITPAYNLPCDYVIHTVGPRVKKELTEKHCAALASCYQSCLKIADANHVGSIAFCSISTGVFRFPKDRAAEIAVRTVLNYKKETGSDLKVIFNVFLAQDANYYRKLLMF